MRDRLRELLPWGRTDVAGKWRRQEEEGHQWTDGEETVRITSKPPNQTGQYVVEVTGEYRDSILHVSNGYIPTLRKAMVLADLYMRADAPTPAAAMATDRGSSEKVPGDLVRQDEWLDLHSDDYEFEVVDSDQVDR